MSLLARKLLIASGASEVGAGAGAGSPTDPGLLLWLKLNGAEGEYSSLVDSSSYNRTISLDSVRNYLSTTKVYQGVTSYYSHAKSLGAMTSNNIASAFKFTGDFSVELAFNLNSASYTTLFSKDQTPTEAGVGYNFALTSATNLQWLQGTSGGGNSFTMNFTVPAGVTSGSIGTNQWYVMKLSRVSNTVSCQLKVQAGSYFSCAETYLHESSPGVVFVVGDVSRRFNIASIDDGNLGILDAYIGFCKVINNAAIVLDWDCQTFIDNTGKVLIVNEATNVYRRYDKDFNTLLSGLEGDCGWNFSGLEGYIGTNGAELNLSTSNFTIIATTDCQAQVVDYPNILATQGGWSEGSFALRFDNTGLANKFSVHWNPGDPILSSTNTFSYGVVRTVKVTRNDTTLSLYVNNVLEATTTISAGRTLDLTMGGNLRLGGGQWDGANGYYKGIIDNVRLYNYVI